MFTQLKKIDYRPFKIGHIRKINKYANKFLLIILKTICFSTILFTKTSFTQEDKAHWQKLKPGLLYKQYSHDELTPFAKLHVLEIDLDKINLAYCLLNKKTTALESTLNSDAIVAFNGAFFSPSYSPIGLRISKGNTLSNYKNISWWQIFSIENNHASINKYNELNKLKNISFAIQSGPALIVKNQIIKKLKKSYARRTAIGIKKNGHVIVVVTENTQITTTFLANFMNNKLQCEDALNLDGGGSTQLSINLPNYQYQVIGLTQLPDAICLF